MRFRGFLALNTQFQKYTFGYFFSYNCFFNFFVYFLTHGSLAVS